jgi:hypothetical protein
MKNWLLKFRISAALDDRMASAPPRGSINADAELRQFQQDVMALHRTMRMQPPQCRETPAFLHEQIMRAVTETTVSPKGSVSWWRWAVATGAAVLVVIAMGSALMRTTRASRPQPIVQITPAVTPVLNSAATALNLGANAPQELPNLALGPLNEELARLGKDVDGAREIVLGSLPSLW